MASETEKAMTTDEAVELFGPVEAYWGKPHVRALRHLIAEARKVERVRSYGVVGIVTTQQAIEVATERADLCEQESRDRFAHPLGHADAYRSEAVILRQLLRGIVDTRAQVGEIARDLYTTTSDMEALRAVYDLISSELARARDAMRAPDAETKEVSR